MVTLKVWVMKLWVWQNRKAWTNRPGPVFTIRDIPTKAVELSVYGWDGLRQTIKLDGMRSLQVQHLTPGETYMFVATSP